MGTEWRQNVAIVGFCWISQYLVWCYSTELISGFTRVCNTEIEYITIHFTLVYRSHCIVSVVTSEWCFWGRKCNTDKGHNKCMQCASDKEHLLESEQLEDQEGDWGKL